MTVGIAFTERLLWHGPGTSALGWASTGLVEPMPHVDDTGTRRRIRNLFDAAGILARTVPLGGRPATRDELLRVHRPAYLDRVLAVAEGGGGSLGYGTRLGPDGYDHAALAAGTAVVAVEAVVTGLVDQAYALIHPSGHHATAEAGIGFCTFNNVAVAVEHARRLYGVTRIAVVDWDVHHGNGTEAIFWDRGDVLTVSIHQEQWFPVFSGDVDAGGAGTGTGANLNVPLPAGSGPVAYADAFDRVVLPALRRFAPELVVVAAGYDASAFDPLGRMLLDAPAFGSLARRLLDVAGDVCDGRLVLVQEGGYSAAHAPFCALAVLDALVGEDERPPSPFDEELAAGVRDLLAHQQEAVTRSAALVEGVPAPAVPRRRIAVPELERVPVPEPDEFVERFVEPGVPVVITGAMASWPALSTWSLEAFADRFADIAIDAYTDFFDVVETLPFAAFHQRFLGDRATATRGYARWFSRMSSDERTWADTVFDALAGDWSAPAFVPRTGYVVPPAPPPTAVDPVSDRFPYRGLFISGPGARTRLHRDPWSSCALLGQVVGRKRFVLYAPHEAPRLMRDGNYVDPDDVDADCFTAFAHAQATHQGTLEPGDFLFLPSWWFHDVTTLSPSISMTWNFVHDVGRGAFEEFAAAHPDDVELAVAMWFLEAGPRNRERGGP